MDDKHILLCELYSIDWKRWRALNMARNHLEQLVKQFQRGVFLLIYDEIEKARRYINFRFQRLIQAGLDCSVTHRVKREGTKITLEVTIEVSKEFLEKQSQELVNKYLREREHEKLWREEAEEEVEVELVE